MRRRAAAGAGGSPAAAGAPRPAPAAWLSATNCALEVVHLRGVIGRPVEHGGEARAAVQLAGRPAALVPLVGGLGQVRAHPPALLVLVEPVLEPRPLAEQRLVGDLDRAAVRREQPGRRQHRQGPLHVRVGRDVELGQRDPPAGHRLPLAADEPEEDDPRGRLLRVGELAVGVLGEAPDRAADAARRGQRRQPDRPAVAALPELDERRREQRQAARTALDLVDQPLDQRRLDREPGPRGRALDHRAVFVATHRPDEHLARRQLLRERRAPRHSGRRSRRAARGPPRQSRLEPPPTSDSMNADRAAASSTLVNTSSNWSTITQQARALGQHRGGGERAGPGRPAAATAATRRGPRTRRDRARASARRPGRRITRTQLVSPRAPASIAGTRPARTADDLPLPDGPMTPRKPCSARRATISDTRRSRPKKTSASLTPNVARPTNGQASPDSTRRRAGAAARSARGRMRRRASRPAGPAMGPGAGSRPRAPAGCATGRGPAPPRAPDGCPGRSRAPPPGCPCGTAPP